MINTVEELRKEYPELVKQIEADACKATVSSLVRSADEKLMSDKKEINERKAEVRRLLGIQK